jgi:flavin reductase (DIM6/NTAB) family NADH-FMN oxidoreductase RutF
MKRPWNIPDMPVYSLATYNNMLNMNICTYVTAISMKPKLYGIAIYNNTKTLENVEQSDYAVLQLLHPSQYSLVNFLGKKSGKNYNKQDYLLKKGLLWLWDGYEVLKNISACLLLKKVSFQQTGDHVLYVWEVEKYVSFHSEVLTTSILSEKKIIRI